MFVLSRPQRTSEVYENWSECRKDRSIPRDPGVSDQFPSNSRFSYAFCPRSTNEQKLCSSKMVDRVCSSSGRTAMAAEVPWAAGQALGAKSIKKKVFILSSWDKRTEYARSETVDVLATEPETRPKEAYNEKRYKKTFLHPSIRSIRRARPLSLD